MPARVDDHRQPLVEQLAAGGEGRQVQRRDELVALVGEDLETAARAAGELGLVVGALRRETVDRGRAGSPELREVVAKAARLGRAPTRAGDRIPAVWEIDARFPASRIHVQDRPAGAEFVQTRRRRHPCSAARCEASRSPRDDRRPRRRRGPAGRRASSCSPTRSMSVLTSDGNAGARPPQTAPGHLPPPSERRLPRRRRSTSSLDRSLHRRHLCPPSRGAKQTFASGPVHVRPLTRRSGASTRAGRGPAILRGSRG